MTNDTKLSKLYETLCHLRRRYSSKQEQRWIAVGASKVGMLSSTPRDDDFD
eukprot:CAMPEP_0168759534 /NCGR_PEP_ID=MMETSP0724-20121128/22278_1 /TAXON_ID=265536 /ORGANISM="Amphiprora sp., Strain CCMP467" /LENGTH=50 /DNA_ID=CAMNT_0008808471 /DNA_START=164 /DNA_END=313 /DNA_ORIENTATION=-